MEIWIQQIMEQFGYIGVAFLIMIENVFPPIPSEVILTFGGFMTTNTNLTITGMIIVSTIGSVIGALILYGVGSFLDITRLEKIVDRWGHILRLSKKDLHKANQWFLKHGVATVFFCRFIPLIRSLISIPAGMAKMKIGLFLFFTTVGSFIWNTILIYFGALVGSNWKVIVYYMSIYSKIAYVIIFIVILAGLIWLLRRKKKNKMDS
ncbi:DedA family protein [Carnobacterium funditum]|uniref:DedA family protein n=1 Tax=Carnobacterium funditum TaxID=2752 RepID=UPI0005593156|nr:DedA family protein [Carnobacterium funditum]